MKKGRETRKEEKVALECGKFLKIFFRTSQTVANRDDENFWTFFSLSLHLLRFIGHCFPSFLFLLLLCRMDTNAAATKKNYENLHIWLLYQIQFPQIFHMNTKNLSSFWILHLFVPVTDKGTFAFNVTLLEERMTMILWQIKQKSICHIISEWPPIYPWNPSLVFFWFEYICNTIEDEI